MMVSYSANKKDKQGKNHLLTLSACPKEQLCPYVNSLL